MFKNHAANIHQKPHPVKGFLDFYIILETK